jgi:Signal transduction histidine kinase involved in nitrogen fixation and metabolism regulation
MAGEKPKRIRFSLWLLGGFVLVLLTLLVLLQSSNLWKSFTVESAGDTLLLYGLSSLNFAAFVVFGFIFLRSIVRLVRERKALTLGSKLKTRLLFYFVMISILPIIAMAGFSLLFMNRAIDRWFVQIPENIVRLPEEIEDKAIAERRALMNESARMLARSFEDNPVSSEELRQIAVEGNLAFAAVIDKAGETNASTTLGSENQPEMALIQRGSYGDPLLNDGFGIDAAAAQISGGRMLVIARDLGPDQGISETVVGSLEQFDRLKAGQITVRQVGFLTLGVLTFMLIFASMWTAFYVARGLTTPLKALAEGAEKIAQGELGHRVDVLAEDELALMVSTFNQMSAKLEANSAELTERRRYIETVLLSLPTGVISIDAEDKVSTINPVARNILALEPGNFTGSVLSDLIAADDLENFERLISRAKRIGHASDQTKLRTEIVNSDEGLPVSITATALPENGGVVLVIEDLSELISAQRASAWQEVARRMAHEIKNPLTPIQLSAERIARRFVTDETANGSLQNSVAPNIDGKTERVVKEGTDTIIREVQSLKSMVDEFSRFARLPNVSLEPGDVNEIIEQAAALYSERTDEITIELKLASELPTALLDSEQLKRVFVNLIDNAVEAPTASDSDKIVLISSRHDAARDIIVVEVADNGNGIDPAGFQKLFQPYFSTKGRGTGLGLAIVQRIVAEHRGKIKAVANQPRGAKFIVEIPIQG